MQEKVKLLTNQSRLFAILMAFSGGALDVYCHTYFHGLVSTQTGNVILLATNVSQHNWEQSFPKIFSIVLFTVGFLLGIVIKRQNLNIYWRSCTMLPIILSSLITPFLNQNLHFLKIGILAFGGGLIMLTFTGVQIEGNPYTIMMTSGNYRRMLNEWSTFFNSRHRNPIQKRNAHNYTIVVGAFILGAFSLSFIQLIFKSYSIWIVTISLFIAFIIEVYQAKREYSELT